MENRKKVMRETIKDLKIKNIGIQISINQTSCSINHICKNIFNSDYFFFKLVLK